VLMGASQRAAYCFVGLNDGLAPLTSDVPWLVAGRLCHLSSRG
jgi:hypothetical protein